MFNKIKEKRQEIGLSQQELADKLNISVDYLRRIERGERSCSLQLAVRIAVVLDCLMEEIFFLK